MTSGSHTGTGIVEAIRIAAAKGAPMRELERVKASPGGLEGDRYSLGTGEWSDHPGEGRSLTLVAAESIELASRELATPITPADTRRNVQVRGIDLDALIGREFLVGSVRCRGNRLAEPCTYLEGLIGQPVLRALAHRAGLRADILEPGEIAVGDTIRLA